MFRGAFHTFLSYLYLFLHIAPYLAIVRHILHGLYIFVQCVFASSCVRIWVLGLNDINCQYNVPWHQMHCTLHTDEIPTSRILSRLYTQPKKLKQLRMYNRKGSLLYGFVITAILTGACLTFVIQNFIKTFHFKIELTVTGTWSTCWKYGHLLLISFLRAARSCQNI